MTLGRQAMKNASHLIPLSHHSSFSPPLFCICFRTVVYPNSEQSRSSSSHVVRKALHLPGMVAPLCLSQQARLSHRISTNHTQGNPRSTAIRAVAKANKLDLEIVHTEPAKGVSTEYLKLNKLGKVPTFEGADGYILSECIAIAIYRTSLANLCCFCVPLARMKDHFKTVIPV